MEEKDKKQKHSDALSEINLIFTTLDNKDPCVKTSKRYLKITSEHVYNCSLCNVTIPRPPIPHERRFNIWLHIHESGHKSLLPNYSTMLKNTQEILKSISEKDPNMIGVNCFELGPVYYLIKCSICQCVIMGTKSRIRIHIQNINHREKYLDILENCKGKPPVGCKNYISEKSNVEILDPKDSNSTDCKDDTLQGIDYSVLKLCEDGNCMPDSKSENSVDCKDSTFESFNDSYGEFDTLQGCQNYNDEGCKTILEECTDYTVQDDNLECSKSNALEVCAYNNGKKLMPLDLDENKEFHDLLKFLPEEFNEDKHYFKRGYNPGYLMCTLCSTCIVSSQYYFKSHLISFWHKTNKENPFYLPVYSRKLPNPVKLTNYRVLSPSAMNFFMLVVKTKSDVVEKNIECISKQLGKNEYYCQPCNKKFYQEEASKLLEIIESHFKEKIHFKNKNSSQRFKLKPDRFLMFDSIPIEIYEDIKLFKVLPSQGKQLSSEHEVFCAVCQDSLPLDLTLFFDHAQSKRHNKMKIMFKISKKVNKVSTIIDEIMTKISSKVDNIKSIRQHFSPDSDGTKILCKLCNSTVGHAVDSMFDLENKMLKHLTNKEHMSHSKDLATRRVNSGNNINKSVLENMFKTISNFDKSNKDIIAISKKSGHLKCKVCSSRFLADISSLKDHIEKKSHKKHIEIWKDNNKKQ